MKKALLGLFMSVFGLGMLGAVNGQIVIDNAYENPTGSSKVVGGTQVLGGGQRQGDSFVNVVKGFLNWMLGILALIALIILLWGGFKMVTAAGNEEQYKEGFTILKQAAMGLAVIGVAWFIVSLIFFVISLVVRGGEGTPGSTT